MGVPKSYQFIYSNTHLSFHEMIPLSLCRYEKLRKQSPKNTENRCTFIGLGVARGGGEGPPKLLGPLFYLF